MQKYLNSFTNYQNKNKPHFANLTSLWSCKVVDINGKYNPENLHYYRSTYYRDARLECLKKLIEIAKEQNVKYI